MDDVQERAWAGAVERGDVVAAVRFGVVGARCGCRNEGQGQPEFVPATIGRVRLGKEHQGRRNRARTDCPLTMQRTRPGTMSVKRFADAIVCQQRWRRPEAASPHALWRPY
jgi:hypothetical protein